MTVERTVLSMKSANEIFVIIIQMALEDRRKERWDLAYRLISLLKNFLKGNDK